MTPNPPFFVFDGDCGFCRKWAGWLQRRLPDATPFVEYQELDDLGALGLSEREVRTASYWVDADGGLHRGERSFAAALRAGPFPWRALGLVLGAPVVRSIAGAVYRRVVGNRHRLPAPDGPGPTP